MAQPNEHTKYEQNRNVFLAKMLVEKNNLLEHRL
jgi:hypothetical protein